MEDLQSENKPFEPSPESTAELLRILEEAGDKGLSLSEIAELTSRSADFPTVLYRLRADGIINMSGDEQKPDSIRCRHSKFDEAQR